MATPNTPAVVRLMMLDDEGLPKAGVGFDKLGVRPRIPDNPTKTFDVRAAAPRDVVRPEDR